MFGSKMTGSCLLEALPIWTFPDFSQSFFLKSFVFHKCSPFNSYPTFQILRPPIFLWTLIITFVIELQLLLGFLLVLMLLKCKWRALLIASYFGIFFIPMAIDLVLQAYILHHLYVCPPPHRIQTGNRIFCCYLYFLHSSSGQSGTRISISCSGSG